MNRWFDSYWENQLYNNGLTDRDIALKEFEDLLNQCDHKDKEISGYKDYVTILETEISKL